MSLNPSPTPTAMKLAEAIRAKLPPGYYGERANDAELAALIDAHYPPTQPDPSWPDKAKAAAREYLSPLPPEGSYSRKVIEEAVPVLTAIILAHLPAAPVGGTLRCPHCAWALYDGHLGQNKDCVCHGQNMRDCAIRLTNEDAQRFITAHQVGTGAAPERDERRGKA